MSLGREVFVIHGRDKRARGELFTFLRAIGLDPIEWPRALAEASGGAPLISDILDKVIRSGRAFLVLLTPDDMAYLKPEHADGQDDHEVHPMGQARPNVLFEAGMAFGRYPDNTVLVEFGKVRRFTDVAGRFTVMLDNSPESRAKLAQRLKDIGCEVNLAGTDWFSAGDLIPPTSNPQTSTRGAASASANKPASPVAGPTQPEFTVSSGRWSAELGNFALNRRFSSFVVHGEVTSHEPDRLTYVLKATFFGANGQIIGSGDGIANDVGEGEGKPVEIPTMDQVREATRVHVTVDEAYAL
jgi:hypothetical protein